MKTLLVVSVSLALASAQQGGGFFSNIGSAFNSFFGGRQTQQRPQQRPIRQQQFAQPAQQPQQPQFAPQPQQFQQQPQQTFQPQQTQFQPQQNFQQPPAQPQQQFFQPQPPRQAAPARPTAAPALRGGTAKCPAHEPNHFWTDPKDNRLRGYVVTWKFTDDSNQCSKMQQHEAKEYCQSMGMEPVSLDSPPKQDEFNRLIASDAQRYFWTGGIVDHAQETVFWSNRNGSPVRFDDSRHWSHTGGAKLPQPDNRAFGEEGIAETCLGILNNFYADGIKWHDVACHHKKPTVCEPNN